VRALSQAVVVYGLAFLLGVKINWNPLALAGVLTIVSLAAVLFSTFSLIIACTVKTRERFMGIGQVLTMPINFLSAVALGFIVGITVSGQTFYNFTLDNLRYFGTLKAMGTTNRTLLQMMLLQALMVGTIGYGLGVGIASLCES